MFHLEGNFNSVLKAAEGQGLIQQGKKKKLAFLSKSRSYISNKAANKYFKISYVSEFVTLFSKRNRKIIYSA